MTTFEGIHYLLCALGDGSLFYFNLNMDTGEGQAVMVMLRMVSYGYQKNGEILIVKITRGQWFVVCNARK